MARRLLIMDLEGALNAELSRLAFLAGLAARRITAKRSWWSQAIALLKKTVR